MTRELNPTIILPRASVRFDARGIGFELLSREERPQPFVARASEGAS